MATAYQMKEAAALSNEDLDALSPPCGGGIGDIHSDARGSGARFNSGKVPYELLPLYDILAFQDVHRRRLGTPALSFDSGDVRLILESLGQYQRGHGADLDAALRVSSFRWHSLRAFAPAARVLDHGRKKYAEWNWAKGMPWSVPLGCAVRHCLALLDGEELDSESGLEHLGHLQANLLMLLVYRRTYPEGNDLPWAVLGDR